MARRRRSQSLPHTPATARRRERGAVGRGLGPRGTYARDAERQQLAARDPPGWGLQRAVGGAEPGPGGRAGLRAERRGGPRAVLPLLPVDPAAVEGQR